ncbi:MAG: hypothetical protein QGI83_03720, partial [Candidatus Latescibacteria bacterium]|nr:hypothetical protein [Candidatus Latescibacterota bacterium]
ALRRLAELASREHTGARALVSVCERALLKFEKCLPSTQIRSFTVTAEVVDSPESELTKLLSHQDVDAFVTRFRDAYGIELTFEDDALVLLAEEAAAEGISVSDLCDRKLQDYGHGLKLLGHTAFEVSAAALGDSKAHLDVLIKAFYAQRETGG